MTKHFDIAVIGGGPGGYAAAGRATQLGKTTVLIEKDRLGGVCLNWGCIPTKALLDCAHAWEILKSPGIFGLTCSNPEFNFEKIISRSRSVADRMNKGVQFLMKQRGVTVIKGIASLGPDKSIHIEGDNESITADHIILATGGRPTNLPGVEFDGKHILNSTHAMSLTDQPSSLIIVGAGAIGMEFADFYRSLGTEVTVIEMLDSVLPIEDKDIIKELNRSLRRRKIKTLLNTKVQSVLTTDSGVQVTALTPKGEQTIDADAMLVAIGVTPNSEELGLAKLGVKCDRGFVMTDSACKTNVQGIYAIGDLTGAPMLAHKASMEALVCVNGIADHPSFKPINPDNIPGCTYCRPQVASVGITEQAALEKNISVKTGVCPFRANGRSIAMNESDGIVKLIFEAESLRLIGAHILHANASELIAELGVCLTLKATCHQIAETIHAHPTLSEAVMEAAAKVIGEAIHI